MRIRVSWTLGVIVGLAGCRPAAAPAGASEADVEVPATMEACASLAAARKSDDGQAAPFSTIVHLRIELAAYRARALCLVSDDGHAVMLEESSLGRVATSGAEAAIEFRTTAPVRAIGARFLVADPARSAYRWEGVSRHALAPSTDARRSVDVRLYEDTERPRAQWPALSWRP